jgi:LPS export ABC transporter protein LptC
MSFSKILITLAFLLIIGGGVAAIIFAGNQTEETPNPPSPSEQAAKNQADTDDNNHAKVVGKQVTFTITEGAHKRWDILSAKAYYFDNANKATIEGITGTLFNDEGKASATFTAPAGTFDQIGKELVLTGGVTVKSAEEGAASLTAPQMTWSPKIDKVLAIGGVHMIKKGFGDSTANQCQFKMDFSSIELVGNAQTQMDL